MVSEFGEEHSFRGLAVKTKTKNCLIYIMCLVPSYSDYKDHPSSFVSNRGH